jgi:hypothetical protein
VQTVEGGIVIRWEFSFNFYSDRTAARVTSVSLCNNGARAGAVGWGTAGSMSIGIFHWLNLSERTVALGSTQLTAEMSTSDVLWGKGVRCVGLTTLPPSRADCLENLGASTFCSPKDCPGLRALS